MLTGIQKQPNALVAEPPIKDNISGLSVTTAERQWKNTLKKQHQVMLSFLVTCFTRLAAADNNGFLVKYSMSILTGQHKKRIIV